MSPTQSDKTVELADVLKDFYWSCELSSKFGGKFEEDHVKKVALDQAIAALTARENRMVQEVLEKVLNGKGLEHPDGRGFDMAERHEYGLKMLVQLTNEGKQ